MEPNPADPEVDVDEGTPSGSTPEPDAPPDDPEASLSSEEDEPPSPDDDDDEPAEWKSLEKKFENIEDERERRRAIGKQYWEKTRYASEVRKENEDLKRQLEDAREARISEARRESKEPDEPPPPHPDLERLDFRIDTLSQKDTAYYEEQQKLLVTVNKTDQDIAAVNAKIEDADEYQRAVLEQRLEGLTFKKQNVVDRFNDLHDRREDLGYRLDELQAQRQYAAKVLSEQERQAEDERQSLEEFSKSFPGEVSRQIDILADAAGLDPEDEALRTDLKETVRDRLTVKFWRLGNDKEADDRAIEEMVESEVKRYIKSRDLVGRAKFGKTSKEKLSVSGRRPAPARRSAPKDGAPAPKRGYDDEPKDVSALGTVSQSPSMMRGRAYLRRRGL